MNEVYIRNRFNNLSTKELEENLSENRYNPIEKNIALETIAKRQRVKDEHQFHKTQKLAKQANIIACIAVLVAILSLMIKFSITKLTLHVFTK